MKSKVRQKAVVRIHRFYQPAKITARGLSNSGSGYDEKDDDCAKKLMAAVITGRVPIDWEEARRIAASPKYNCLSVFEAVKSEVEAELAKHHS